MSESELSEVLPKIDGGRWPNGEGENSEEDPLAIIRAVNALQPLGKEKALSALREYATITGVNDWNQDFEFILRSLFKVPKNGYPPYFTDELNPPTPRDLSKTPAFPLLIADDVPVVVAHATFQTGPIWSVEPILDEYEKHGVIRDEPLTPPDDPLHIPHRLFASTQWIFDRKYAVAPDQGSSSNDQLFDSKQEVEDQICTLLRTVYKRPANPYRYDPWEDVNKKLSGKRLRWNKTQNMYTFEDGSTIFSRAKTST